MTHQIRSTRLTTLALLCSFTALFLWGCSGTGKISGFFPFWRSNASVSRPSDKDLAGFASLIRSPQGNADAHYNLARYLVETGRYKEAITEFRKVAAMRPESALAYNGLGICYDSLGEFPKATQAYQVALEIDPNLGYVHNNLGYSLLLQERYDEAIDSFKKAIALDGSQKCFHNNLGRAYALAGKIDLAIDELELAGKKPVTPAVVAERYEQTPSLTTALNNPEKPSADTPKNESRSLSANGKVELLNGNGVNGMARKMRAYLKERGFKVVRCANADSFDYPQTSVYYRKDGSEAAQQLVAQIPDIKNVKEVNKLDRDGVTVKMLMGQDLKPFKNQLEGERR